MLESKPEFRVEFYELGMMRDGNELEVGMNQSQTYQIITAEPKVSFTH